MSVAAPQVREHVCTEPSTQPKPLSGVPFASSSQPLQTSTPEHV
jgi:hypothetical protein